MESRNEYMRAYLKKLRARLKAEGICVTCRKEKAEEGHSCCLSCLRRKRIDANFFSEAKSRRDFISNLLATQGGKCAICKIEAKLVLDHCHATEGKRGLICQPCNIGLGMFKDKIEVIECAARYLAQSRLIP